MTLHCTMTFYGMTLDKYGMPEQYFHYFVVAKPGPKEGSGVAAILSLTAAKAKGMTQGAVHTVMAESGGSSAALAKAEMFLAGEHPALNKLVSEHRNV